MSEYHPINRAEALARWNKHMEKHRKHSALVKAKHLKKYEIAADCLRKGMSVSSIIRDYPVGSRAVTTAKKMIEAGEI